MRRVEVQRGRCSLYVHKDALETSYENLRAGRICSSVHGGCSKSGRQMRIRTSKCMPKSARVTYTKRSLPSSDNPCTCATWRTSYIPPSLTAEDLNYCRVSTIANSIVADFECSELIRYLYPISQIGIRIHEIVKKYI